MNSPYFYSFLLMLSLCNAAYTMEKNIQKVLLPEGIKLAVQDVWLNIIAQCPQKNILRETCKYFRDTVVTSNESILLRNPLVINHNRLKQLALYHAYFNNHEIICNFLNQGLDPNIAEFDYDYYKNSLLNYAIQNNNIILAEKLLSHPRFNSGELSESFCLALDYNLTIARKILAKDAKVLKSDYYNALSDANIEIIDDILICTHDKNETLNKILLQAAECGHVKLAIFVLDNGAHVNYEENYRGAALHLAANHPHMLKLLITRGASINNISSCSLGQRKTPLEQAINIGNFTSIQTLINHGASLDTPPGHKSLLSKTMNEWTPSKSIRIVQFLLNKGVDVNERSVPYNNAPLNIAASSQTQFGLIPILLAHPNIDINVLNDEGETPLDVLIKLKERQAEVDERYLKPYISSIELLQKYNAKRASEL
jgi:hypothetical protein